MHQRYFNETGANSARCLADGPRPGTTILVIIVMVSGASPGIVDWLPTCAQRGPGIHAGRSLELEGNRYRMDERAEEREVRHRPQATRSCRGAAHRRPIPRAVDGIDRAAGESKKVPTLQSLRPDLCWRLVEEQGVRGEGQCYVPIEVVMGCPRPRRPRLMKGQAGSPEQPPRRGSDAPLPQGEVPAEGHEPACTWSTATGYENKVRHNLLITMGMKDRISMWSS
jgi:hypothetical protein